MTTVGAACAAGVSGVAEAVGGLDGLAVAVRGPMVGGFTSMGIGSENAPNRGIYGNDVEHEHCRWMCIGQSYAQRPDTYHSVTLVKRKKETEGRLSFIGKVLLKK